MNSLNLCSALRALVRNKWVVEGNELELREDAATNKCKPIHVRCRGRCWGLRLGANENLPFLEELSKEQSVTKLPDYLLFAEPPPGAHEAVRVVVGEIKSSETGATSAKRQVQTWQNPCRTPYTHRAATSRSA
jgi:hypothetical protein